MKNQKAPSKRTLKKLLKNWDSGRLTVRKAEGYSGNAKELLARLQQERLNNGL